MLPADIKLLCYCLASRTAVPINKAKKYIRMFQVSDANILFYSNILDAFYPFLCIFAYLFTFFSIFDNILVSFCNKMFMVGAET